MPFHRQMQLLRSYGINLSDSTLWMVVDSFSEVLIPLCANIRRLLASSGLIYLDDTTMRMLEKLDASKTKGRKSVWTTGLIGVDGDRSMALYITSRNHAGDNLRELLRERPPDLPPPIRMADALARNTPRGLEHAIVEAKCLVHSRRKFVEASRSYPDEAAHALGVIRDVYRVEAVLKHKGIVGRERLRWHQRYTAPRLARLHQWLENQVDANKAELTSSLGTAVKYMLNHWHGLTAFLRIPYAPLDNNALERALRKVVLNRKNWLFHATQHGADVGDLYLSVITTCRLNGVLPYQYLLTVLKNREAVAADPDAWMPWNYATALAG